MLRAHGESQKRVEPEGSRLSRVPLSSRSRALQRILNGRSAPPEPLHYEEPLTYQGRLILGDETELARTRRERLVLPMVLVVVGVLSGCVASSVHAISKRLLKERLKIVFAAEAASGLAVGGVVYVLTGAACALLAALIVEMIAPAAAGSGMTTVLLFLNGWLLPDAFRIETLLVKLAGLALVSASGLAAGEEAPLIHAGTIVGSLVCDVASRTVLTRTVEVHGRGRSLIDLAATGGGAALAGAFLAPVSGVLFVMEELGTFWSKTLLVRCFVASASAAIVGSLYTFLESQPGLNPLTTPVVAESLLEAEVGISCTGNSGHGTTFLPIEYIAFAAIGAIGGVAGSGFNAAAAFVLAFRSDWLRSSMAVRIADVAVVATITGVLFYTIAASWPCTTLDYASAPPVILNHVSTLGCPAPGAWAPYPGGFKYGKYPKQWNELASLLFAQPLAAAGMLLSVEHVALSAGACAVYATTFCALAVFALGMVVPMGLLLPSVAVGAGFGRAAGILAGLIAGQPRAQGVYALMGAAAFVSGTSHNTIAFVMILIELMNNTTYILPCIVTMLCALSVSQALGKPFYETQLDTSGHPYLRQADETLPELNLLTAADVMAPNPTCLRTRERVGTLAKLLADQVDCYGFPLIDALESNRPDASRSRLNSTNTADENWDKVLPLPGKRTSAASGAGGADPRALGARASFRGFVKRDSIIALLLRMADEIAEDEPRPKRMSRFDALKTSGQRLSGRTPPRTPPRSPGRYRMRQKSLRTFDVETGPGSAGAEAGPRVPPDVRQALQALGLDKGQTEAQLLALAQQHVELRDVSEIVPHVHTESAPIRVLLHTFLRLGAHTVTVVDARQRVVGMVRREHVTQELLEEMMGGITKDGRLARALAPHESLGRGLWNQIGRVLTTDRLHEHLKGSKESQPAADEEAPPAAERAAATPAPAPTPAVDPSGGAPNAPLPPIADSPPLPPHARTTSGGGAMALPPIATAPTSQGVQWSNAPPVAPAGPEPIEHASPAPSAPSSSGLSNRPLNKQPHLPQTFSMLEMSKYDTAPPGDEQK